MVKVRARMGVLWGCEAGCVEPENQKPNVEPEIQKQNVEEVTNQNSGSRMLKRNIGNGCVWELLCLCVARGVRGT